MKISMNMLAKITKIANGHFSYVQSGKARVSPPMMRVLAAILGISDIEAWIVAVWGLEGPIDFRHAQQVADVMRIENQQVDARPYLRRLPVACRCVRCGHEWYKKTNNRPGTCPHCACKHWDAPEWTATMETRYQAQKQRAKTFWGNVKGIAKRREIVQQRTGKAKA